jgi:hypothetical protein
MIKIFINKCQKFIKINLSYYYIMFFKYTNYELKISMNYNDKFNPKIIIEVLDTNSNNIYFNSFTNKDINYDETDFDIDELYDALKDHFTSHKKIVLEISLEDNEKLLIYMKPDKFRKLFELKLFLHLKYDISNKEIKNIVKTNFELEEISFDEIYKKVRNMPNYYLLEQKLKNIVKNQQKKHAIYDITSHFVKIINNDVYTVFNQNMKSSYEYNKNIDINISDLIDESKNNDMIRQVIELIIEKLEIL